MILYFVETSCYKFVNIFPFSDVNSNADHQETSVQIASGSKFLQNKQTRSDKVNGYVEIISTNYKSYTGPDLGFGESHIRQLCGKL